MKRLPLPALLVAAAAAALSAVPAAGAQAAGAQAAEVPVAEAPAGAEAAAAQPAAAAAAERTLRVGTKEAPPFAVRDPRNGAWRGLSIDLWGRVADRLGWTTRWSRATFRGSSPGCATATSTSGRRR